MQRKLMLALAAAITFGFAAAAPASAANLDRAKRITYVELDLGQRAGAEAMLQRIENAANAMCGEPAGNMPVVQRAAIRQCIRDRSDRAVAAVNHAGVSALYYGRNPEVLISAR